MRSFVRIITALSICLVFIVSPGRAQDTLTIIHVNDTHSNLISYGGDKYGSLARVASLVGKWAKGSPNPILVHGGDFYVGTLMFNTYFGVAELQILDMLNFDVLQLGNHEFDAGPDVLGMMIAQAQLDPEFEIISTNATNLDSTEMLGKLVLPYAIETRGRLKIGIFGFTSPSANSESNPAPVVFTENYGELVATYIDLLKKEGCQVIILLSHLGLYVDMQLASELSGIDLIVSAHSHDITPKPIVINEIPIIQAGEFYHYVGKAQLVYNGERTELFDYELQEITDEITPNPEIDAMLEQLKGGVYEKYVELIGDPFSPISNAATDLIAYPEQFDTLDTPIGNLITRAIYEYADTMDCAIEACGHIVEGLYAGPVTPYDLFRTYSYGYEESDGLGFRMATFELYGAELLGVMSALVTFCYPEINYYDYLLQSCELSYSVDVAENGSLQLGPVFIKGNPVDPGAVYKIASSDRVVGYLINLFQIEPKNLVVYKESIYYILLQYVSKMETIKAESDGHINVTAIENPFPDEGIRNFELGVNFPNPFNPQTSIPFTLDRSSEISLELFDITGKIICAVYSGKLAAGRYNFTWTGLNAEGSAVASGIYFYRLSCEQKQTTRKMVLMR